MSTGVCIINRNGIALAADSAGTFTGNKMFYNSMNKLFSLSRKYVYGAITYGSTCIYNTSIEQILKEFRIYLDEREEIDDFFEILEEFANFIEYKNKYFKFDVSEKHDCESLIKALVVDWGNKIKSCIGGENPKEKIHNVLCEFQLNISNALKIDGYDVSDYIKESYIAEYENILNVVVPEIKEYPEEKEQFWTMISSYFNLSLKRETDKSMGLFFAGYGKNDAFPKTIHIEVYTTVNGKLKYSVIKKFEESNQNADIIPLAQSDVILTFCKGISQYFINYIPQKIEEIINTKIDVLPESFSDKQKAFLKKHMISCKNDISSSINATIHSKNAKPILDSVQLIPLPEMALLAENLVNITSLKRTFALDGNQQTVGGPTDVAVMSKGDGFVWIKRKLYFDKDINMDYQNRSSFK